MKLEKDTIITLEDDKKYIITDIVVFAGENYYMALGLTEDEKTVTSDIAVFEGLVMNNELHIGKVDDPILLKEIIEIFKKNNSK